MSSEPQKPEGDEVIWRYMSAHQFLDLFAPFDDHESWVTPLAKPVFRAQSPGRLWFSFPRAFESYWEGRLPTANENALDYCRRMAENDGLSEDDFQARLERLQSPVAVLIRECNLAFTKLCGVSCWTQNSSGSGGMWSFTAGSQGIAIRSTVNRILDGVAYSHGAPAKMHRVVYERFVANFYQHHLTSCKVKTQARYDWLSEAPSQLLPAMRPDLLIKLDSPKHLIVLDTKFYVECLVKSSKSDRQTFRSSNLYQMYAYLMSQSPRSELHAMATGILLYPTVDQSVSEAVIIQGHRLMWETIDLRNEWKDVENALLAVISRATNFN